MFQQDSSDKSIAAPAGVYLAFDYGDRRIGVACGNTLTSSVMPLSFVSNKNGTPDWQTIESQVEEWNPVGFVVGDPLTTTGEVQEMTRQARGFARRLSKLFALPFYMSDERFSSIEAGQQLKQRRQLGLQGKTRRADTDKLSAAIVLQRWFDDRNQN